MAAGTFWTDQKIEDLRRRWQKGETASNVAVALQISRNAVIGKVHRLGLSGRPSPICRNGVGGTRPPATHSGKRPIPPARPPPAGSSGVAGVGKPVSPTQSVTAPIAGCVPEEGTSIPSAYRDAAACLPRICCWPIGEPGTSGFRFCDQPLEGAGSYCATHHARAYVLRPRHRREETRHVSHT